MSFFVTCFNTYMLKHIHPAKIAKKAETRKANYENMAMRCFEG